MRVSLRTAVSAGFGVVLAVGLLLVALYWWRHAGQIVDGWEPTRPSVAAWAVRSAAVAAAAGAQLVLLTLVTGRLYRRQLLDDMVGLSAGLVATLAMVSAIALALAGR